jgi:hypothetical protein
VLLGVFADSDKSVIFTELYGEYPLQQNLPSPLISTRHWSARRGDLYSRCRNCDSASFASKRLFAETYFTRTIPGIPTVAPVAALSQFPAVSSLRRSGTSFFINSLTSRCKRMEWSPVLRQTAKTQNHPYKTFFSRKAQLFIYMAKSLAPLVYLHKPYTVWPFFAARPLCQRNTRSSAASPRLPA